jgi:hypothetical protein
MAQFVTDYARVQSTLFSQMDELEKGAKTPDADFKEKAENPKQWGAPLSALTMHAK